MQDTTTIDSRGTGATLQQGLAAVPSAKRFSPAQREVLHRLAYTALASGDYAQARRWYEGLALYGGADSRAWRGAAAAAHAQQEYRSAWLYWTLVSLLEGGPPDAAFYAARCQAQLGELAEACAGFELVADDDRAPPALRTQAAQLLSLLQRRAQ